jgi:hypothetical protein
MNDHGIERLLYTLASGDPDRLEQAAGMTFPTPDCIPLSRLRGGVLRHDWREAERQHKQQCAYCQSMEGQASREVWHPPMAALFWNARGFSDGSPDLAYHLRQDDCLRCRQLTALFQADRVLGHVASQARQGLAGAADRLGRMLSSMAVGLASCRAGNPCFALEVSGVSASLSAGDKPRLRLDLPGDTGTPGLLRVLIAGDRGTSDHFVVPVPGKGPQTLTAELSLESVPEGLVMLAVYEVDAAVLDREDGPRLQALAAAARHDPSVVRRWQEWATGALKSPGVEAGLKPALEGIARAELSVPPGR